MTRSSEDDGFLGRWARRKELARRGEHPEDEPGEAPAEENGGAAEVAPASDEQAPVLTDEDMPDIESLGPTSDVSPFFSPGVSQALRRKALRRLFHTPRFNVKDGLDDYDDDYTQLKPLGNVVTSELRRQRARVAERQRLRDAEAAEREETAAAARQEETATDSADAPARADAPDTGASRDQVGSGPPADGPDAEGEDPGRPA